MRRNERAAGGSATPRAQRSSTAASDGAPPLQRIPVPASVASNGEIVAWSRTLTTAVGGLATGILGIKGAGGLLA
jgi:hypothetical protein